MAGCRSVSWEVCAMTCLLGLAPHPHTQIDACHVETDTVKENCKTECCCRYRQPAWHANQWQHLQYSSDDILFQVQVGARNPADITDYINLYDILLDMYPRISPKLPQSSCTRIAYICNNLCCHWLCNATRCYVLCQHCQASRLKAAMFETLLCMFVEFPCRWEKGRNFKKVAKKAGRGKTAEASSWSGEDDSSIPEEAQPSTLAEALADARSEIEAQSAFN